MYDCRNYDLSWPRWHAFGKGSQRDSEPFAHETGSISCGREALYTFLHLFLLESSSVREKASHRNAITVKSTGFGGV
jgi:hypothetical protein